MGISCLSFSWPPRFSSQVREPYTSEIRSNILWEFHASPTAGHPGFLLMYESLTRHFYWQGLKRELKQYIAECSTWQQNKYETSKPGGLLQPLPIRNKIWEDVSMDFIEELPLSFGKNAILVVDCLTKYGHFLRPIPSLFCQDGRWNIHQRHFKVAWYATIHCLGLRSDFYQWILEGVLCPTRYSDKVKHGLPSSNGWPNWGGKSLLGDLFAIFYFWQAQTMEQMASLGRMELQYIIEHCN